MQPVKILPPVLVTLLLPACSGSIGAGALQTIDVSAEVRADCPHPAEFLHITDWEIMAGAIGDELIECRDEKRVAVKALDGQGAALSVED